MPKYLPPKTGGDFELPPSGTHVGVCYRFIDLGTQDTTYNGQPKRAHQVMLSWELPDEKMKDGRPFSVHKRYTWSTNEKANLRKDLESWRGAKFTDGEVESFDISTILGKGCMVSIVHDAKGDKTYANITSVSKLPKGIKAPEPENDTVFFDLDDFDEDIFDALSDGIKQQIEKSPEYKVAIGEEDEPPPANERDYGHALDDEIPF